MKNLTICFLSLLTINTMAERVIRGGGAADPGGGDTIKSSLEQVEVAFERARLNFANTPNGQNIHSNIAHELSYYLQEFGQREDGLFLNEVIFKATYDSAKSQMLMDKLKALQQAGDEIDPDNLEDYIRNLEMYNETLEELSKVHEAATFENYFSVDKFILEKDKPCFDQNGEAKDGSVTEHSVNGKICISLKNLMTIAPYSLEKEITGLIFHEITHLAGLDEEVALRVQNLYLDVADHIILDGKMGPSKVKMNIQNNFTNAINDLYWAAKAIEFEAKYLDKRPSAWKYKDLVRIGAGIGQLNSLADRIYYLNMPKDVFGMSQEEIVKKARLLSNAAGRINFVVTYENSQNEKEYLEKIARTVLDEVKLMIKIADDFGVNTKFFFGNFEL